MFEREAFSGTVGNVLVKLFSGGKPPSPFCYFNWTINSIGQAIANAEGDEGQSIYNQSPQIYCFPCVSSKHNF